MTPDELAGLGREALIQLVLAQAEQIEALRRQVAELLARLNEPPKSSSNSSVPPSRDRKANKPPRTPGTRREASVGRAGGGRPPHPDPDRVVEAWAKSCPSCAASLDAAAQRPVAVYDRIGLPPIRPVGTRITLHGGGRPCRPAPVPAPAPPRPGPRPPSHPPRSPPP